MARYVLMVRREFHGLKNVREELAQIDGITYVSEMSRLRTTIVEADSAVIERVREVGADWLLVEEEQRLFGNTSPTAARPLIRA